MWCRDCHREVDVKAAGSACPLCGRALTASTRQTDDIRRAYEILERWQSSDLFERISTTAPLTTFKQQDRAPLLNIPLGKPAVTAPMTEAESVAPPDTPQVQNFVPVQEPPAERRSNTLPPMPASLRVPRELLEPAREFVGVTANPTGTGRKEQLIWDLLVAPTPLMANVLPQSSSQLQLSSAAVVPPTLVAGVSERPLPGSRIKNPQSPPTLIPRDAESVVNESAEKMESASTAEPEIRDVDSAEMQHAHVDTADANQAEPFAEEAVSHNVDSHDIDQTYARSVKADDDSLQRHPGLEAATIAGDARLEQETDDSEEYESENLQPHDADSATLEAAQFEAAKFEEADQFSAPAAADDLSHLENLFADLAQEEFSQESAEVEFRETRSSDGQLVLATTEQFAASAEVSQNVLPVLMSSASVHEEPATLEFKSAESANDTKQTHLETTNKTQRSAIRRPPLHRRFQLERPVSESSAGSEAVTRKLRLDQTGGNAATPQEKEPVTSLPSSVAPETKIVSNSPMPGKRFRIDKAESVDDVTDTAGQRSRTHGRPRQRYIDEAHESQLRGPHFEVSAPKRSNLTSMTGQFLAYLGVLGLTVGTAMVIYGHFGGYSEITPTGWLVTTVAQMLLFLGVINLVSGGIEQNNDDVSRRINTLGEQLLRIEQVTSEVMRGPKIPAHMYAEDRDEDEVMESQRETAVVKR
jgi:hypothetical protein